MDYISISIIVLVGLIFIAWVRGMYRESVQHGEIDEDLSKIDVKINAVSELRRVELESCRERFPIGKTIKIVSVTAKVSQVYLTYPMDRIEVRAIYFNGVTGMFEYIEVNPSLIDE